ncbi:MAG TPA: response regulator [Pirellulaceae bacterium]|nr:response regulator [Planctomycetales bacterium]MCB9939116.1 response regulator [Planctomycetaceae bacterium]HRX80851.1 response regulator [Pirellulaceae bacterium]
MHDRYILVAEDDTATAKTLWYVLVNNGFDATIVTNGQEAWEASQLMQFDLVITDYQMPEMDGGKLCELLRRSESYFNTPIILTTAKCFELDIRQLQVDHNLIAVFQKPFSPSKVGDVVKRCLLQSEFSTSIEAFGNQFSNP